jgi:stalled ribosome rescue protein Dom34
MTTFHALVWVDQQEAHVLMFDREHVETQRIKSRSHFKHQGKSNDSSKLFTDVAKALQNVHEVLLTGPGQARDHFRDWCQRHQPSLGKVIVGSVVSDHPTDPQLLALARQYFKKFDRMGVNPSAL